MSNRSKHISESSIGSTNLNGVSGGELNIDSLNTSGNAVIRDNRKFKNVDNTNKKVETKGIINIISTSVSIA